MTALLPGLFVVIWATGFIVAGIVSGRADPFTFLVARHGFSIAVFAGLSFAAGAAWPRDLRTWRDLRRKRRRSLIPCRSGLTPKAPMTSTRVTPNHQW